VVGSNAFDQRHLIELYRRGLINELPLELGPMPIFDLGPSIAADLQRWNVIDTKTGQLSEPAGELLAGVTNYEWAVWGIVLLYNERTPIISDLPEEFLQYGVQYALRDIPRVTFLIGYRQGIFTTATMAGGHLSIASDRARSTEPDYLNTTAGSIISAIVDPKQAWEAYPLEEFSIPAATADALKRDRSASPDDVAEETQEGLYDAGMARTTVRALSELLKQDNVALAQITLTQRTPQGKKTAGGNAVGLMFFTGKHTGVVVSYPTRGIDGRQWITYESATPAALGRAIGKLHRGLASAPPASVTVK
jgi:hypothetical protein